MLNYIKLKMNLGQELINLPRDVIYQIMIRIPYHKLNRLCSASKITHQLYNNEQFWLLKSQHDFNILVNSKPIDISWKQYYDYLYETLNPKMINMYFNDIKIATEKVRMDDILFDLVLRTRLKHQSTFGSGNPTLYHFVYKTGERIIIDNDYLSKKHKTLNELNLYHNLKTIEVIPLVKQRLL